MSGWTVWACPQNKRAAGSRGQRLWLLTACYTTIRKECKKNVQENFNFIRQPPEGG